MAKAPIGALGSSFRAGGTGLGRREVLRWEIHFMPRDALSAGVQINLILFRENCAKFFPAPQSHSHYLLSGYILNYFYIKNLKQKPTYFLTRNDPY
jgi:hypothetical protein